MRSWMLVGMALAVVLAVVLALQATGAGSFLAEEGGAMPAWWYALVTTGVLLVWSGVAVLPGGNVAGLTANPARGIEELAEVSREALAANVPFDSSAGRWIAIASAVALGVAMAGGATFLVRARTGR